MSYFILSDAQFNIVNREYESVTYYLLLTPFNALIVGPKNSGKTRYLVNLLSNEFRFKFDYIILLCKKRFGKTFYEKY